MRNTLPDLDCPAMVILRSSHKAGKVKPRVKSSKELVSRTGQRTQLAPPRYAESTKLVTAFIWGHWTKLFEPPGVELRVSCAAGRSYVYV